MRTKVMLLLWLFIGAGSLAMAQDKTSGNWKEMHTARIKKHAENKAEALKLEGDKKTEFIALFTEYENEMSANFFKMAEKGDRAKTKKGEGEQPKELTDAEAKEKVDKFFQKKQEQLEIMQKNLDVQKKYRSKFEKLLTPQQVEKVFREPKFSRTPGNKGARGNFKKKN